MSQNEADPAALPEKPAESVHRYLSVEHSLRVAIVDASQAVRDMQTSQQSYPLATMALGRSMVAASLMASHLKEGQSLSLCFRGNGPLDLIFAEASFEGNVRGYTSNPRLDVSVAKGESISVGPSLGQGTLTVVSTPHPYYRPHRGTVEIQTGEIGEDVAYYLQQSQQIPSVVSLGVRVNPFGLVDAAGGILIELMPGAKSKTVDALEAIFKKSVSISTDIFEGANADALKEKYLKDFGLVRMEHPYELNYSCRCSKERLMRSLMLLGMDEIDEIISGKDEPTAQCGFCGKNYALDRVELTDLRNQMHKESLH